MFNVGVQTIYCDTCMYKKKRGMKRVSEGVKGWVASGGG